MAEVPPVRWQLHSSQLQRVCMFITFNCYKLFVFSDGRVSERTKSLIRRLLLLEPSQRLTTAEVLDCLSVTIAIPKSMSTPLEPLQVRNSIMLITGL